MIKYVLFNRDHFLNQKTNFFIRYDCDYVNDFREDFFFYYESGYGQYNLHVYDHVNALCENVHGHELHVHVNKNGLHVV